MKLFGGAFLLACLSVTAIAEITQDGFTVDGLFEHLSDQFQDGGFDSSGTNPDFRGMMEDGNRQLREAVEERPGHAFGADKLISLHQGSRYMTLRLSEGLGNDCSAPTVIRLTNQTISGPLQVEQFIEGEWELLAFYNPEACSVVNVELVRPGMADFVIEHQLND